MSISLRTTGCPTFAGCSSGNRATVLALSGMVSPAACPPPHAAARRLGPRRAVHLVRREYRHLRPRVALSEPGRRLADGRNRKAGKLVSADDHQLRAGQPGAAAAGAGYTPRTEEQTADLPALMP